VIVTMMLAWFDEPTELLHDAVTSAAVIADRIVVADGAYDLVPDRSDESDPDQWYAIEEAADDAGLECKFLPSALWTGQVEKRNALLQAAAPDSDWVMPLDADWRLTGDRDAIRAELADTDAEQFTVAFHEPHNPDRPLAETASHQWHAEYAGQTKREPLLFRALDDMRLEQTHWFYSGVRPDGTRVGLSGGARLYPEAVTRDLAAPLLIEHRCLFRDDKQIVRNRFFCEARDLERERVGYET
jgi:hypothetical protein